MILRPTLPEKLVPLLSPARYKVARGGRGSGKSWTIARILLVRGVAEPIRVLCAREVQRTIRDSVHKLLKSQIALLGLEEYYRVLDTEIRGSNGTEFIFSGLSTLTVDQIKSFEGIDVCWVEEGQAVSKRSWDILIPTIRKDGSEIFISYNPDLESDETHQRFTVAPPGNCINIEINWRDNPWFNDVLEKERQHCFSYDPDNYDNIWEGKCKPAVEGAIYFKRIQEAEAQGRVCHVPYDPVLKVHPVLDLGLEDALGTALVQVKSSEIRIIEYIECNHTTLDIWSAELRRRPYNWGKVFLPHDGFTKTLKSGGKSEYLILKNLGWSVAGQSEVVQTSIEHGIRETGMAFSRMYFDRTKVCAIKSPEIGSRIYGVPIRGFNATDLNWRMWEALKRYRRHKNTATDALMQPIKDRFTHAADVLRYVALNADKMTNDNNPGNDIVFNNVASREFQRRRESYQEVYTHG